MKSVFQRIQEWFVEHETAIMSIIGMAIVGVLCYIFGWFMGAKMGQEPITVFRTTQDPIVIEKPLPDQTVTLKPDDCVYVGSINGTKYYPPDCSYAEKISPENLRCFRSDQDAIDKGYAKTTSCN